MWTITLRDLQARSRQFMVTVVGAGLVFAMALVLTGLSEGFRSEARNTLGAVGADAWVVRAGAPGPFSTFSALPADLADAVAAEGSVQADSLIVLRQSLSDGGSPVDVSVIGHPIGGLGEPPAARGRRAEASGEAVVDQKAGLRLGEDFTLTGRLFRVVGLVRGMTVNAGIPVVFIPLEDAQALAFDGRPMATAIVTRGTPVSVPDGLAVLSNAQVGDDLLRPLRNGITAIDNSQLFLWLVAAVIIGVVTYLSALERSRDFAVLKSAGASWKLLFAGLAAQAVIASLLAAGLAALTARLLTPAFPLPVTIPRSALLVLPAVAVGVGLLASLSGLRRVVTVDPVISFART